MSDRNAVETNLVNETFPIVSSRFRQNRKFGNFTFPFGRLCQCTKVRAARAAPLFSSYDCFVSLLLLKISISIVVCFSCTAPLHEYYFPETIVIDSGRKSD